MMIRCAILFVFTTGTVSAVEPEWTGRGGHRLLLKVAAIDIGDRAGDELVARAAVDFASLIGKDRQVDLTTLQVHRYNPATGKAEPFKAFDNAVSPFDRPCRFEDDTVPDDYPDRASYSSEHPEGRGPATVRKRGGRLFNRLMHTDRGHVIWVHTQEGDAPAHYALYFDVVPAGDRLGVSPAPWIGDVDVLRRAEGHPLTGMSHFTVCAGDLNSDGLPDLMGGTEKGDLMWFPNRGAPGKPRFDGCLMFADETGITDCGWYAAPFIIDYDNDGLNDVLAGTSHNVILWWKNVGSKQEPKFHYRGFVQADGGDLRVPESPVPEDTNAIFARDYYNQPWVGDFNGDGMIDLLTGGYTTGMIFYYKGIGRDDAGVPKLAYVGPLEADGQPIDTVWAAAPCAADFDGDGDMDLVSGGWFWSGIPRKPAEGEDDYLFYFENTGSAEKPEFRRTRLPMNGRFPSGGIARPNAVDFNRDGLPDLLVSDSGGSVYVFPNIGERNSPMWAMNNRELTAPWAFSREWGFANAIEMDGRPGLELVVGNAFRGFEGSPHSPRIVSRGHPTVNGQAIDHPGPGYGDPYYYMVATDWDHDGIVDLLWGTHQGNVHLHRGISRAKPFEFAEGVELKLVSGEPMRVGPAVVDSPEKATDFTILQGSRIIMIIDDFDGDDIDDIGVTETYGNLLIFRNTKTGGIDTLEPGVNVGKVYGGGRSDDLTVVDWNVDGKPDLLIGQTAANPGTIYLNIGEPGKPRFDKPIQPLNLPYVFWGASLKPMDWNEDGDEDFLIFSEFYAFYAERSFLRHGYVTADLSSRPQHKGGTE